MKCCICEMPYDPEDCIIRIDIEGKTAALCPNCTRAAAFGISSARENKRFKAYRPLLWAPMFEEEQIGQTAS